MSSGQGSQITAVDATSGDGSDSPEPELKRRKLLDAGGPIEDDETARQKMRDAEVYERRGDNTFGDYAGFDPDNVADIKVFYWNGKGYIKPMGYFAERGDLPMMRWLYVNGADTRDEDVPIYFPMWMAALRGKMEVCKWLFAYGAAEDIKRRTNPYTSSPLRAAFGPATTSHRNISRWLILNGALCQDDASGDLDFGIMRHDILRKYPLGRFQRKREALLEWTNDLHRPRTSFLLFLSGAHSASQHACSTRQNFSAVRLLAGKSGVLELIGDYVGFARGREARIIRQLAEMLPILIQELDGKEQF